MVIVNNSPQSVNEMTDLMLNYALKFPVDAVPPAAAEAAGQWVVKRWTPPPPGQPVSPAAATGAAHSSPSVGRWGLYVTARWRAHRTHPGLHLAFVYFMGLSFILILHPKELFWIAFSLRNFHLWFANMGPSCGFSPGIVVMLLLLLLDGKLHPLFYFRRRWGEKHL